MPLTIRMLIYHALFSSHLNYCCQIWGQHVGNISFNLLDPIRVLQNTALKQITFSHARTHNSPLYKFLNVLKFSDIVAIKNMLLVYDIYNGTLPSAVIDTFNIDFSHPYSTLACGLINSILKSTTTYGTGSLKSQAIESWNNCQRANPEAKFFDMSRSELKKLLSSHFLENY